MKKIIRLTESDLARIVRRVINEQEASGFVVSTPGVEISFEIPGKKPLYYDCKSGKVSDSIGTDISDKVKLSSVDKTTLGKWCSHKGSGYIR